MQLNKVYLIKFETASHFIIFENDIWYGIYKDNPEIVEEYKELNNGQLKFIL